MRFVNYSIEAKRDVVLSSLKENDKIVMQERFESKRGVPKISLREKKNNKIKLMCEFVGRETKDNGFLEGTYFIGSLKEADERTSMKGIILTAPIYHTIILIIFSWFIYQCFKIGGFSPVPVILLAFNFFMFKDEFKKQRIIKAYIFRAFKNTFASLNHKAIVKDIDVKEN